MTMISRPSRAILRNIPATRSAIAAQQVRYRSSNASSSKSGQQQLSTSATTAKAKPFVEYAGQSPEAKARVYDQVRRLQSSATANGAAAVRPAPAPHFQAPPNQNTPDSPFAAHKGDPNVKDGFDHTYVARRLWLLYDSDAPALSACLEDRFSRR